ncbi:hypothetical protein HXX76_003361 [Chlamydomonas incerta]|uniref:FCP1 homology domain-containing protein n=1 Tax=Chlamydomonas incerta TaxID=51695 RepID=A0A835W9M6_CHLIN|nr:hypothetical protein HXX76_003361 [Chlamydomonas incerta]|eukprot:KAG2441746.1 hypothetical protein HXX76_003361 [Chlamydomonas incerta]
MSGEDLRRHCLLKAAKATLMAVEGLAQTAPSSAPVSPSARTLVIDLECLCSNVCFYDRTQGFVQRVLPRPHVRLFLESVRAHFRLAVWSSRSRAWMSCALATLDPAQEFLDFRSQLAAAASDVDYETEGLPTILDDGQGVDPADVVVVTLCRASFGSLADSVIEVPPFDVHAAGATGQAYDTVLLSLAALLVRHLGLNAASGADSRHADAADVSAAAADGGADSSAQQVLQLEGDVCSMGSGASAGNADEVAPPAAPQRRPVREELRRLGLSETRFGEAALGLLGGECPAAVSYVLEDMAPQRNPHAPHPHDRPLPHTASRAAAVAAGLHRAPELVLEAEDEDTEDAAGSQQQQRQQQPWQEHAVTTILTPLQLSRLELVDVRADIELPTSPASPAELPFPNHLVSGVSAAASVLTPTTRGASVCSAASVAVSTSGSSATRSSAASAAAGSAGSAADSESHIARVPSCLSLRWRSAWPRPRDGGEGRCDTSSVSSASGATAEPSNAPGPKAHSRHASPIKAAFRRLSASMRGSLRSRTAEVVKAAEAAAAPDDAVDCRSGFKPSAASGSCRSYAGAHAPSAFAAAAACDGSVLSEPESCGAAAQSTVPASAPTGTSTQWPRDSELLTQRGSNHSDSSACSAATHGSGSSSSSSAVTFSVSGCVSAGRDCPTYTSSGSISSGSGGVSAACVPRTLAHGRSSETRHKVLGVTLPTVCVAAPSGVSAQLAAVGATTLLRQDADADAPAMAAAAARILNAAMRVRCPELPGGRIALLCAQPNPAGPPATSLRAQSGFVTPVPAAPSDFAVGECEFESECLQIQRLPCATDAAASVCVEEPIDAIVPEPEACVDMVAALEVTGAAAQEAAPAWTAGAPACDTRSSRLPQIPTAALSSASFTSSSAAAAAAVFGDACSGSRAGSLEALDRASLSEPGMLSRLDLPLSLHDTLEESLDVVLECV